MNPYPRPLFIADQAVGGFPLAAFRPHFIPEYVNGVGVI